MKPDLFLRGYILALSQGLETPGGLPCGAFSMVQDVNRFLVLITHYNMINAGRKGLYRVVPQGNDPRRVHPFPNHWVQIP